MLDKDLIKHNREFKRYLANNQFEQTEDGGILFPKAGAIARGMYVHGVNGQDWQYSPNILPTEGLNSLLDVALHGATQITAWYLGLFSGAVTPGASLTAATVTSVLTEITSGTEGYSESTRVAWDEAAASAGAITNTASKAAFTIVTATSLTVNGCFLASASAKGATTGKLMSATRFASARSLSDADIFNLGYSLSLTSS